MIIITQTVKTIELPLLTPTILHPILIKPRVHNKRRKGEYPTLTIPCTNALRKVPSVNHRVLSFCINTLRETKGTLIGVTALYSALWTQGRY